VVRTDGPISSRLAGPRRSVDIEVDIEEEETLHASTASRIAVVVLLGMLATIEPGAPAIAARRSGYVTILFGRTQFTTVDGDCRPASGAVDLDQVAADLLTRHLTAVGTVVVDRTKESGFACWGRYALQPDWTWIEDRYGQGWRFVSAGRTYTDMTTLPPRARRRESCGSLASFKAHGIHGADGLFAYPNNHYSDALQKNPVSRCFAYGRRYDTIVHPNMRSEMHAPWFARTYSVNGGTCNDPALPCYTVTGTPEDTPVSRYASPEALIAAMHTQPRTWFIAQFYRFVMGSRTGAALSWDCTSADWRQHYTSRQEIYCYGDFLTIMDGLQDAVTHRVTVSDPATVARAWKP
jgi:hypothetical protein